MTCEWYKLYFELDQLCKRLGLTLSDCRGYTEKEMGREVNRLKVIVGD